MDIYKDYISELLRKTKNTKNEFIYCQVILGITIMAIALVAFRWIGLNHPFLKALFIAIVDTIPVLGSGILMLPYILLKAISGEGHVAQQLLLAYMVIVMTRELVGPFILSRAYTIRPIIILIIGLIFAKLFGTVGTVIGGILIFVLNAMFQMSDIQTYSRRKRIRERRERQRQRGEY